MKHDNVGIALKKHLVEKPLNTDELDNIQAELEEMLCAVVVRHRRVNDFCQNYLASSSSIPGSTSKRSKNDSCGNIPNKKFKIDNSNPNDNSCGGKRSSGKFKIKCSMIPKSEHVTISERKAKSPGSTRLNALWPQNQMPQKFIDFVEQFTGFIEKSDFNHLCQLIDESDPDSDYSINLNGNRSEKSKFKEKKKRLQNGKQELNIRPKNSLTKNIKIVTSAVVKKLKSNNRAVFNGIGPLTDHLIQALVEENPFCKKNGGTKQVQDLPCPSKNLLKSLKIGDLSVLEDMVKKELNEQGLLDDEQLNDREHADKDLSPADEVAQELRQRQNEIAHLQKYNYERLQALENMARDKARNQEFDLKLAQVDFEIRDLCSKFYGLPPAIKRPNKREREILLKTLKSREKLVHSI
uniref:Uncharacterized protein n=1 Tax=Romanomermis culicivorax TaxID=13658 RepID=A0A915KC11_ROMCU